MPISFYNYPMWDPIIKGKLYDKFLNEKMHFQRDWFL